MTLTYADVCAHLSSNLTKRGEWAGVPIPMPDAPLEVESRHPLRDQILAMNDVVNPPVPADPADDGVLVINRWWSERERCEHVIVEVDGKREIIRNRHKNGSRIDYLIKTMRASEIWKLDTELTAMETLETLIKPHLFEAYFMSGSFLETSKRSGLTYIFRRLAPTLVISPRSRRGDDEGLRILCALCLHPIAYYRGTHAGAMVPTDDVIAHLLMMRADEHLFWKRANQHSPHSPEANFMF